MMPTQLERHRGFTDHQKACQWASADKELTKLKEAFRELEDKIDSKQDEVNQLHRNLSETVGAQKPRRMFDIGQGNIVLVERYKRPQKKKVGDTTTPDKYGVRVELIAAEKS